MYKKYQHIILFLIATILIQLCISDALAITREQVIKNAEKYANYEWTVQKGNANSDWNTWEVGQTVTGVAYNWGGFDTIEEFKENLEKSITAGNTKKTKGGGTPICIKLRLFFE